jgi:hypothetical protein
MHRSDQCRLALESDHLMTVVDIDPPPASRTSLGCVPLLGAMLLTLLLSVCAMSVGAWALFEFSPLSAYSSMPADEAMGRIALSAMDALGEDPHLDPPPPAERYPIARSVPQGLRGPLVKALDLMRATPEGERLFTMLVENDVLISVEPLEYNAGYTSTAWSRFGWRSSEIVISGDAVRSRTVDVLAAVIVHEAAHAERAISEEACFYRGDCETLPNGVQIEEELYAHEVEARWWREMYGDDGKGRAFGTATGENALLDAYQDGNAAFERYVRDIRGDSREGAGL